MVDTTREYNDCARRIEENALCNWPEVQECCWRFMRISLNRSGLNRLFLRSVVYQTSRVRSSRADPGLFAARLQRLPGHPFFVFKGYKSALSLNGLFVRSPGVVVSLRFHERACHAQAIMLEISIICLCLFFCTLLSRIKIFISGQIQDSLVHG